MQGGSCGIDPAQGAPISMLVKGNQTMPYINAPPSTPHKAGKQMSEPCPTQEMESYRATCQ